jgi:hypothetical protein
MGEFLELARRRDVVRRALRIAAIVGTLLIAINHGDRILGGRVATGDLLKMFLTVFVPYGVSTVSSVAALRGQATEGRD